ncbi:D-amino-acid transaminase [Candidatus Enterococcus ferrettii]|uniref:D-alanine aminotransferase n=1 Tax=Candidatus Enterococcus ferrettii TaxID=2815324 RepID=A0ABV0ELQ8_9ENTE|nr:D-amino-acid transaminase [Enterococcus sp. 665A]MBO1339195.1 D-amino-acid transaminase [Enterococcus sp. 665A]
MYYIWKGNIVQKEAIQINLQDRGYQFGDGLYEVVKIYNGKFFTLDEHLERMQRGAAEIYMNLSYSLDELKLLLHELKEKNKVMNGYVYFQITRGDEKLRNHGFDFYQEQKPVLSGFTVENRRNLKLYEQGVTGIAVPDKRWLMCQVKSLNLLANAVAKHLAQMRGVSKAVLVRDGIVTEEKSGNVLMIKDGIIYSHPEGEKILSGITKLIIRRICLENSIPYIERPFTLEELYAADEVLVTDTNSECASLVELDGKTIGEGRPGSLAKKIQSLYEQEVIKQCGALD